MNDTDRLFTTKEGLKLRLEEMRPGHNFEVIRFEHNEYPGPWGGTRKVNYWHVRVDGHAYVNYNLGDKRPLKATTDRYGDGSTAWGSIEKLDLAVDKALVLAAERKEENARDKIRRERDLAIGRRKELNREKYGLKNTYGLRYAEETPDGIIVLFDDEGNIGKAYKPCNVGELREVQR